MPEKNPPAPSPFAAQLQALIARRGLDEPRAAGLLGVPVFTLRKWAAGTRTPSASALRLLDILGTLEALAPALLDALEPPPPGWPGGERESRLTKGSNQKPALRDRTKNQP